MVMKLMIKQAQQRKESIEAFKLGSREDLISKETQELKIIEQFLPEQIDESEIKNLAQKTINEVVPKAMPDNNNNDNALSRNVIHIVARQRHKINVPV